MTLDPTLKTENATTTNTEMSREQMRARISLLSGEIDANDEENRMMQAEIDSLYVKLDAMKAED